MKGLLGFNIRSGTFVKGILVSSMSFGGTRNVDRCTHEPDRGESIGIE